MPMSLACDLAKDLNLTVGDDTPISSAHLESTLDGWLAGKKGVPYLGPAQALSYLSP